MGRKKLVRKAEPPSSKRGISWPRWTGLRGKTVWDWLQLLIVPLMLAAIGLWFTAQQDARQRQIEEQRAQDLVLQGYLDQMSTLVLEDLSEPKVQTMLQARTLTALRRLDASRKTEVMRYLEEAELVNTVDGSDPIIGLTGTNLSGIHLPGAELSGAYLFEVDLSDAYLSGADLGGAYLIGADLSNANLSGAYLINARLNGADLSNADLGGTDQSTLLQSAYLSNANLRSAEGITNEELAQQAESLEGATMPNGQKYEDWLKDKESHRDDE